MSSNSDSAVPRRSTPSLDHVEAVFRSMRLAGEGTTGSQYLYKPIINVTGTSLPTFDNVNAVNTTTGNIHIYKPTINYMTSAPGDTRTAPSTTSSDVSTTDTQPGIEFQPAAETSPSAVTKFMSQGTPGLHYIPKPTSDVDYKYYITTTSRRRGYRGYERHELVHSPENASAPKKAGWRYCPYYELHSHVFYSYDDREPEWWVMTEIATHDTGEWFSRRCLNSKLLELEAPSLEQSVQALTTNETPASSTPSQFTAESPSEETSSPNSFIYMFTRSTRRGYDTSYVYQLASDKATVFNGDNDVGLTIVFEFDCPGRSSHSHLLAHFDGRESEWWVLYTRDNYNAASTDSKSCPYSAYDDLKFPYSVFG